MNKYRCTTNPINGSQSLSYKKLNGGFFCGMITKYNYNDTKSINKGETCPEGLKQCGYDTPKPLCYPEEEPCPINDLIISDTKLSTLSGDYIEQTIQTGVSIYLYTSN